jgi:hypothetical protein
VYETSVAEGCGLKESVASVEREEEGKGNGEVVSPVRKTVAITYLIP